MRSLWGKYKDLDWEWLDDEDGCNSAEDLQANYEVSFGDGWLLEIRGEREDTGDTWEEEDEDEA